MTAKVVCSDSYLSWCLLYSTLAVESLYFTKFLIRSPFLDALASCPPEEMFLCRLIKASPTETKGGKVNINFVKEALASRHSATTDVMKYVMDTISSRRAKNEYLSFALNGKLSSEGWI